MRPRRLRRGRIVVCVLLLASVLAGLTGCQREVELAPPTATPETTAGQTTAGAEALRRWVQAVEDRDTAALREVLAPTGTTALEAVVSNAEAVGVRDLHADYVETTAGSLDASERARYGKDAWVAEISLDYRAAVDEARSSHEVTMIFVPAGAGARIAAVGGGDHRSPLWLTGPLQVARAGAVAVLNAGSRPTASYLAQAQRAVSDVRRLLPRWRGPLVLEVPRDKAQLDAVLEAEPQTYANIAAVTTTVDGSVTPGTPVHVYLNPAVFGTLKSTGAQVVITHEATHVATGASFVSMPKWLSEGFADYVALDRAGVPVERAASQAIRRLRQDGLPSRLPTPADLQPTAENLGATYEEAWLACRFLGQEWGSAAMVRFYRTVADGTPVARAFRDVLGLSRAEFVQRWRADLQVLLRTSR